MPASEEAPEAGEHLLDDVIVLLDVTSSEVRRIVTRQLESWGASCITPDDRATSQAFDLYLTDNPSNRSMYSYVRLSIDRCTATYV